MISVRCIVLAAALSAAMSVPAQTVGTDATPNARRIGPDHLAGYWLLLPDSAEANVPNAGYGLDKPTCVAVSYVVEKNGTTSHVKLEKIAPDGPFAKVALSVVRGMRFAAATHNAGKDPVWTYVIMPFNLPDPASTRPEDKALRARVLDACQLPDFLPQGH